MMLYTGILITFITGDFPKNSHETHGLVWIGMAKIVRPSLYRKSDYVLIYSTSKPSL